MYLTWVEQILKLFTTIIKLYFWVLFIEGGGVKQGENGRFS